VNWFKRLLGGGVTYEELNAEAAELPPGCEGLLALDHFQVSEGGAVHQQQGRTCACQALAAARLQAGHSVQRTFHKYDPMPVLCGCTPGVVFPTMRP
jgi:hypothetical protein